MATVEALGNVVVATDFTYHAHDAAARAAWLPLTEGAAITLVHVLPPRLPGHIESRLRATADAMLSGALATVAAEQARSGQSGVDVFTAVEIGRPADVLATRVRDERAELLLVGRGARHGLGERLLGSTSERIVRAAETNVLVVASSPAAPYRRPLVAVDMTEAARGALALALRVVERGVEHVDVVHAYDAPYLPMLQDGGMAPDELARYLDALDEVARARVLEFVEKARGRVLGAVVRQGPPRRVIVEEAAARRADLLVLGRRGHSLAGRLLLGSVAEAVTRAAPCDVLVAR